VEIEVKRRAIQLFLGDITTLEVDAIVNAANEGLRGGGGVDGAIHRAGGPEIMEECRKIGRCLTGEAVVTTAGRLKARKVIHTVGPIWSGGKAGEPELLAAAYCNSLRRADELGLRSIAFPSISTGAYGYPIHEAAVIALQTCCMHLRTDTSLQRIVFALFTQSDYDVYEETLKQLARQSYCAD